jgi:hypothetical protein
MPLQPVPPQYTPRTFQNIEERLRRLERGGSGRWVSFDPLLPGFTAGTGAVTAAAYKREGTHVSLSIRCEFGSGATPTTGADDRWSFRIPDAIAPDGTEQPVHIPLVYAIESDGVFLGSLQIIDDSTAVPDPGAGYRRVMPFVSRAIGAGSPQPDDLIVASPAWVAIGTPPADALITVDAGYLLFP